jgi:hypothetical protein
MALSTTPAPRVKARRPEKTWSANVSAVFGHGCAVRLTSVEARETGPAKVETFHYFVEAIPSDFGHGFHLTKFVQDLRPGEPAEYHVLVGDGAPDCECRGWLRWGHKTGSCKHIRAIAKLLSEGKLPPAPCRCGAPAAAGPQCLACSDAAAGAAARRADLAELDAL